MLVSVIIPSYNRYKYLLNAIDSVRSQNVPTQIIVINDGSTDERYYGKELVERIGNGILIHSTPNSGEILRKKYGNSNGRAAYARNLGLKVVQGDYVAFLDDDDVWLPKKLELQIRAMEENNCGMSCTEALLGNGVYNMEQKYELYMNECNKNFFQSIGIFQFPLIWSKEFLLRHNSCITSSVILKREILGKVGEFPYKRVGEDYEMWKAVLQHTNCAFLSEPLIYYDNQHGEGIQY